MSGTRWGSLMKIDHEGWTLVTGGSGFIGGALVRRLLALGCRVRVISRFAHKAHQDELRTHIRSPGQLDWFEGDPACLSSMSAAFADVTYVFHVAALVNSAAPRAVFDKANVRATQNVCELSLRNGVAKLIHVSTADVFGLPEFAEIFTEKAPYRPWAESYADSKIRAAEVVKEYRSQGLVSSMIYPGWVYGPGDRAFLPALVSQIRSGLMPNWSPNDSEMYLVFVEDLVDGLLLAATSAADNEDFLMLDDTSGTAMKDLCEQIASYFDIGYRSVRVPYQFMYLLAWMSHHLVRLGAVKTPLLTTTDVKSFGYRFRFSAAKARDVLGWSPRTSFIVGMEAALRWYSENLIEPETKSVMPGRG